MTLEEFKRKWGTEFPKHFLLEIIDSYLELVPGKVENTRKILQELTTDLHSVLSE